MGSKERNGPAGPGDDRLVWKEEPRESAFAAGRGLRGWLIELCNDEPIEDTQAPELPPACEAGRGALTARFGKKAFYTGEELETVASELGLRGGRRKAAGGMFAEEEECAGFLQRLGSAQGARELRVYRASQMFGGGFTVSYDSLWNRFHDADNEVGGGIGRVGPAAGGGGFFGDGEGEGGFDGGGGCGGDGGE